MRTERVQIAGIELELVEPADQGEAPPKPQVLDAFCAAFNAGDLDRLTSLLLDTAEIEVVRVHTEYGPEAARRGVFQGMLFGLACLTVAAWAVRAATAQKKRLIGATTVSTTKS